MTPLVSYAQMTHVARAAGAQRVREQLGRPIDVHIDRESRGPWSSARAAWEATPGSCRWRVLLQDDVDLAPDFADALEWLLMEYGSLLAGRPLALYNGLGDQPDAGEHWIERRDGVQGPAIVLGQPDVAPMLEWCERFVRDSPAMTSSDIRPSLWLEAMGRTSLCPSPSWLNHRGYEPSLNGTRSSRSQPRTAPTWDPHRRLASIDWTLGLAPRIRELRGRRLGASERVRWHLWRTWQREPDHELYRLGLDPWEGMPRHRGGLAGI